MPKLFRSDMKKTVLAFLIANLLFGLGTIAAMPAFEGIDEISHFSRMKSEAYASQRTVLDTQPNTVSPDHISADVFDYSRQGPMPYWWVAHDWIRNVDQFTGYRNYHGFFDQPERFTEYDKLFRQTLLSGEFIASPQVNPEYQHPPLYYVLFTPVVKAMAGHVSIVTSQLIVRCLSYLMAFMGLLIGLLATWWHLRVIKWPRAEVILALGAFYPFIMPVYFWEFGHLTNDALCLLLFGIIWALFLWHLRSPRSEAWVFLGIVIGLGLLTKALMIPVAGGLMLFLALFHFFVVRKSFNGSWPWLFPLFGVSVVAFLVGGVFYLLNYLHSGSIGATAFSKALAAQSVYALFVQNFSVAILIHDFWLMICSFVWFFSSWSVVVIGQSLYLYFTIGFLLAFLLYVLAARQKSFFSVVWLPLWAGVPLLAGLVMHIVLMMLLGEQKTITMGTYLHILGPIYVLLVGVGLEHWARINWLRKALVPLAVLVVLADYYIAWAHMVLFSACAEPSSETHVLPVAAINACLGQIPMVTERLAILAWPTLSFLSYGLGFVCVMAGFLFLHNLLKKTYHN